MYEHHIVEMAQMILEKMGLYGGDPGVSIIADALRAYWKDKFVHVWSTADIQQVMHDKGYVTQAVFEDQKVFQEIAAKILDDLDSTVGITWDTLDAAIDAFAEQHGWVAAEAVDEFAQDWLANHDAMEGL